MAIKFYQNITCPDFNRINDQIISWLDNFPEVRVSSIFWNPLDIKSFTYDCKLFRDWASSCNLKIKTLAITVAHDVSACGPHTDTPPARFKLSWPVMNSRNTYNRWFCLKNPEIVPETNHLGGKMYPREHLEEICRREVSSPAIIDAGIIHDVWFDSGVVFPRMVLQCQLFNEPNSL